MENNSRVRIACDSCFARKIKCNGARPRCIWCFHNDIPCTFERDHRLKKDTRTRDQASRKKTYTQLSDRINTLEQFVAKSLAKNNADSDSTKDTNADNCFSSPQNAWEASLSVSTHEETPRPKMGYLRFAGRRLGTVSSLWGMPLFSPEGQDWIRGCTGESIRFDPTDGVEHLLGQGKRTPALPGRVRYLESKITQELPDLDTLHSLLMLFNESPYRLLFPVIDTELFKETIEKAYSHNLEDSSPISSSLKLSILAFFAFASALNIDGLNHPSLAEQYATKARFLVPFVLQESVSMSSLDGFAMLALFELASGNVVSASYHCALASRSVYTFESNMADDPGLTSSRDTSNTIKEQTRNLFWLCYIIDKSLSLRTGQPSIFNDDMCNLELPSGYEESFTNYGSQTGQFTISYSRGCPLFPTDLKLCILKSKIYTSLYTPKAFQSDDAEILRRIRRLDEDLEKWRLSLPAVIRPTLSFYQDNRPTFMHDIRAVILRLEYHQCMAIIHLSISRCDTAVSRPLQIQHGIHSSLTLSIEASRSTINYLLAASPVIEDHFFWVVISHPLAAVVVLFCNILENPTEAQSMTDLRLLELSLSVVRRSLNRGVSLSEMVHIRHIVSFLMELCRLARHAIAKKGQGKGVLQNKNFSHQCASME